VASDIEAAVGHALRRIRSGRALRLEDIRSVSNGRFSPTTVAGYERGERAISLERFCELCRTYGARPERVLAQVLWAIDGRGPVELDLNRLQRLAAADERLVGGILSRLATRRGSPGAEVIRIRAGDLELLATAADRSVDELLAELGRKRHPSGGRTRPRPS
jgi:transcriptional regulator with XRE-family HTH domain